MKNETSRLGSARVVLAIASVLSLIAIGVVAWLSPRTKITESHAILQCGKKMDARVVFRSSWGLKPADHIKGLDVSIDGKQVPIAPTAYEGLPIDPSSEPMILERKGFPELKLRGKKDSAFDEVYFRFHKYSFSERRVVKDHQSKLMQFFMAPVLPQEPRPIQDTTEKPAAHLSKESNNSTPVEDRKQ